MFGLVTGRGLSVQTKAIGLRLPRCWHLHRQRLQLDGVAEAHSADERAEKPSHSWKHTTQEAGAGPALSSSSLVTSAE